MADIFKLQEFEPAVSFKVRYFWDFGYDGMIEYLHSSLPVPEWASASEYRSTPVPPVGIACVPNSPLTPLLRSHSNHCHRIMGAPGGGKTTVSIIRLVMMSEADLAASSLSISPVVRT